MKDKLIDEQYERLYHFNEKEMKIDVTIDSVILEADKFAGRKMFLEGERFSKGFYYFKDSLSWLTLDKKSNRLRAEPIEESNAREWITFIREEGLKQGFEFKTWENDL